MRALIVLTAWLAAAAPAFAFGHFAGPRPGFGMHPGGGMRRHGHRGHGGLGFFGGGLWPGYAPPADQPAAAPVLVPYPVAGARLPRPGGDPRDRPAYHLHRPSAEGQPAPR